MGNDIPDTNGMYSSVEPNELTDGDLYNITATVYGEVGSLGEDAWEMAASTVFNRRGVREWKNKPVGQILNEGYYANQNANVPFTQAMSGKFANTNEETKFKKMMAMVQAMAKGTRKPVEGQFFFKKNEAKSLKKKLRKVGKVSEYDVYAY